MKKSRIWYALVVLAAVLTGLWLFPSFKSDPPTLDLPDAFQAAYVVSYKSEGAGTTTLEILNQNEKPSFDRRISISLDAELDFNLLSRDDDTYELAFALRPLSRQPANVDSLLDPLEGQFTLTRWGEIKSFQLPEDRYEQAVTVVADILNMISMDLKNSEGSEQSFAAPMAVSWVLEKNSDSLIRLKKIYNSTETSRLQVSGEIAFELSGQRYFHTVSGKRERKAYQADKLVSSDTTEIKVTRLDGKPGATITLASTLVKETMDGTLFRKKIQESMARDTLGTATQESIITELNQIDPKDLKSSKDVYLRLKAHIQLHPDQIHNWLPFLMDYPYEDLRCAHVATALTTVGSEAAQRLLIQAITNSDQDASKREHFVPHLSFADQPTMETESFLRSLAESDPEPRVRGAARLAQGTIAHQVRATDPARSEAILQDWGRKLQSASDEKERDSALRVLGNIGLPEQYPFIAPFLADPNPKVRRQAVNAIRFVNTAESVDSLINALTHDPDEDVRIMASESLGFLPYRPDLLSVYEKVMFTEHQMRILSNILKNLGNMGQQDSRAIDVLKKFAAVCGRTELCEQADGILSTLTHSGR
jgi:hypothetical protein